MEMARETSLPVVCFSALPESSTEEDLDEVYLHLLDLNGYYQTFVNGWQAMPVKVKKIVRTGNFKEELQRLLESSDREWVVLSSAIGEV